MDDLPHFTPEEIAVAKRYAMMRPTAPVDPRIEDLVKDLIACVADKWTMQVLDALAESGEMRFSRLAEQIPGISQKMLTQTLRRMERDGLVRRTVFPVVPPRVEYRLTSLGIGLGSAFCGVWVWAAKNLDEVDAARQGYDGR